MDTSWERQLDARFPGSPWAVLSARLGGNARVLWAFACVYAAAVAASYLSPKSVGNVLAWPAGGLLLLALWLSQPRLWYWIIGIQFVLELSLGASMSRLPAVQLLSMAVSNTAAALAGAVVVRRLLGRSRDMRVVELLRFVYAAAVGAVAGTLVRAITLQLAVGDAFSWKLLIWAQASLLGTVITIPALLAWLVSHRYARAYPSLSLRQRLELGVVVVAQVLVAMRVFGGAHIGPDNVRFPIMMLPALIYAAFRLPPRWSNSLAGGTGMLAMWMVAGGSNPLLMEDPVERVLWLQFGVMVFLLAVVLLIIYIAQSHLALQDLEASQARYRSFMELTREAVWRVELAQPMPVDLPPAQQLEWLRRHASVAESSASYGLITGDAAEGRRGWAADVPWVQMFESSLEQVARDGYRADNLRFSAAVDGRERTYLTAFNGVVREGRLERIWGVARDSTELLDLNARLQREQDLLRSYAQRIAGAEEKARHSTAVDLHNGIGQELSAMSMMLSALAGQLSPEQRPALDELRRHLHKVQQRTRDMVSDLSPPGLYDLGLMPALQWLAVYLRSHDTLRVELDGTVDEQAVPTSLRVLVFRQVRELLRNVARHSGAAAATVTLRGDRERLVITVADEGAGFAWDPAHLGNPPRGLGLWSIGNRLVEVGGSLQVASAPGQGTRVTLELPLRDLPNAA